MLFDISVGPVYFQESTYSVEQALSTAHQPYMYNAQEMCERWGKLMERKKGEVIGHQ